MSEDGDVRSPRRWLPWLIVAVVVVAAVAVVIQRESRIDDLESQNRALEAQLAADPDGAAGALARVAARAAVAEEDARDMIRSAQLQQGRIEALNRRLTARELQGAIATGRQLATCQVAAVRASSAASSVATALSNLATAGAGRTADGAIVRLSAADGAFGQAQRSWVNAAAAGTSAPARASRPSRSSSWASPRR